MKALNFLIFLLTVTITTLAQTPFTSDYEHYSYSERQSKFPFNKATSAKLVSFGIANQDMNEQGEHHMPMKGGEPDLSMMDEVVTIPRADIDSIADILLNTCYRLDSTVWGPAFCYIPRNAVLFYDADGKNFARLEICFECQKLRPSQHDFFFDTLRCDNTYADFQRFFKRRNVKTSATSLLKELDESRRKSEDPAFSDAIDKPKMKLVQHDIWQKLKRLKGYEEITLRDVHFYSPERVRKDQKSFLIKVIVKSNTLGRFTVTLPDYRVSELEPIP